MNTEKPPSQEKKKRKISFSIIVPLGGFFALVLVLILKNVWPTIFFDAIHYIDNPSRINTPTSKSVMVPPIEDTKLKGQAEILSVIASSTGKLYSIQIRAFPETEINAATEFVKALKKRKHDVHMEKVYIQGRGVWNRILVGHFATFEEASVYLKEEKLFDAYPGSFVKLTSEGQSHREGDF